MYTVIGPFAIIPDGRRPTRKWIISRQKQSKAFIRYGNSYQNTCIHDRTLERSTWDMESDIRGILSSSNRKDHSTFSWRYPSRRTNASCGCDTIDDIAYVSLARCVPDRSFAEIFCSNYLQPFASSLEFSGDIAGTINFHSKIIP